MKTVIYVPLVNHLTRRFIAATPVGARLATPLGAAVAAPAISPETPGPRAAILLDQPAAGFANLCVFKHQGDPSAAAVPSTTEFVGGVPYSKGKEPGTFHLESDAPEVEFVPGSGYLIAPAPAAVKAGDPAVAIDNMTVEQLRAHAVERSIDLGALTKKADIYAAIVASGK